MALERISASLDPNRFRELKVNHYISTPEQLLALKISRELSDPDHKNIYLHLCKHTQTALIEQALSFVSDANARHKGKLFSWKIKQLRQEWLAQGKNPKRETITKSRPKIIGQQPELFNLL